MKHLGLLAAFATLLVVTLSCCKEGFCGIGKQDLASLYGEWHEYTELDEYSVTTYTFNQDGTYSFHSFNSTTKDEINLNGTFQIVSAKKGYTILLDPEKSTVAHIITLLTPEEMVWKRLDDEHPYKTHFFKVK
jgi:hypothetical protein